MLPRALRHRGVLAVLVAGCAYVLASIDWRPRPVEGEPAIRARVKIEAPLRVGVARLGLQPTFPVVRAGYPPPRPMAVRERDPIEVRALVVEGQGGRLALILGDLLLVPDPLVSQVQAALADLHFDAVIVAATHTHGSLGAYDSRVLAQLAGTGRYNPAVERHLVDRFQAAARAAAAALAPASLSFASATLPQLVENRDAPDAKVDTALSVFTFRGDAAVLATLAVFAEHPTTLPNAPELTGDVPGEVMRRLEARGGTAFLLQGAVGDATIAEAPDAGVSRFDFASSTLSQAIETQQAKAVPMGGGLAYALAEVGLPPPSADAAVPGFLRRPAANLLGFTAQRTARVGVLRLGSAILIFIPGEPTGAAAEALQRRIAGHAPADAPIRVVSLVQGYLGYVEDPDRVRAHTGEARRTYYGPQLVGRLGDGVTAAMAAIP